MPSLDQLPVGWRGRVASLAGTDGVAQRLMELGLFEGEEIEVIALAPLGDPIEIRLGDSRLSLRRSEAARVQILLS